MKNVELNIRKVLSWECPECGTPNYDSIDFVLEKDHVMCTCCNTEFVVDKINKEK